MAARLEWVGAFLKIGPFALAEVAPDDNQQHRFRLNIKGAKGIASDPYESILDCMQDCEAEVRRLLREAGVVVE